MKSMGVTVLIIVIGYFLLNIGSQVPAFGTDDSPVHNYVKDRYVGDGVRETGAVNLITSIIADYRSFDTFGEVTVLFVAIVAAAAVLKEKDEVISKKDGNAEVKKEGPR